jgi:cell filamentation protein
VPGYTIDDGPDYVLKNKLSVTTHGELQRLETPIVAGRESEIRDDLGPSGNFDAEHLKAIHRHLFQDVYEWAGHTRNEVVRLSDGAFATEPFMRKHTNFVAGPAIPSALDEVARSLRDTDFLRGLPREEFAHRGADIMAEINGIHAFREGNGRTQRLFMEELAKQAGHHLDFTVISQERMIQASIAANEHDDASLMRRMFNEISNPNRVRILHSAEQIIELHKDLHKVDWNERYIATMEPGHLVELTMVGTAADQFMAHIGSQILIGKTSDLPQPYPQSGERFTFVASEHCWEPEAEREQTRTQEPALDPAAADDRHAAREGQEARMPKGEMTDAKAVKASTVREKSDVQVSRENRLREFGDELDRDLDDDMDIGRER